MNAVETSMRTIESSGSDWLSSLLDVETLISKQNSTEAL